MHNSKFPLGRALLSGAMLVGLTACGDGGSTTQSFDLDASPLPTNIVENSGLESSDSELTGWDAYTSEGSDAEAAFAVTSTEKYRGNNAFMASITAIGTEPYHIEGGPVNVPVVAGETYALVAWVKGTAGAMANFTASLAEDPWTTFGNLEVSFAGDWEQVAFTFTLPEDLGVSSIRLPVQMNYAGNVGAEIYIDDMQLIPTDAPPPPPEGVFDVVTNGGLEANDTTAQNWGSNADGTNAAGTSFSVDQTDPYEGNNAFKVSFGTVLAEANLWNVEAGPAGVPVVEGQTYTYSAWVKGSVGSKATFLVQHPSNYHTFASKEVDVTGEWQQVAFEVTIVNEGSDDANEVVRLYAHMGYQENTGAEIFIDHVQLLTQGTELVINGDLEANDSNADNWGSNADGTNAAGTSFSIDTADAYQGNNSFRVDFGTVLADANVWNVEAGPTGVEVIEGATYMCSVWMKGTAGTKATFIVQHPTNYHTFNSAEVDLQADWQLITFEVTIEGAPDPTEVVRLYAHMGYAQNSGGVIHIDKVSLMAK